MKSLKNCIKLSSQIKIYVPHTLNVSEKVNNSIWVEKTLNLLSSCFGGATASDCLGAWVSKNGNLIKEHVTLAYAFCNQENLTANIEKIYDFCLEMKNSLGQEAISLEVNGELYFV